MDINVGKFFIILTLVLILFSCESQTDCGPDPRDVEYSVEYYTTTYIEYFTNDGESFERDRRYDAESYIEPSNFAINLDARVTTATISMAARKHRPRISLFSNAHACVKIHLSGYYIPTQRLKKFTVTSTGSFGDQYPPGTDISVLFDRIIWRPDLTELSDTLEGVFLEEEVPPQDVRLRLSAIPQDSNHIFTIVLEFEDGFYYGLSPEEVNFELDLE